MKTFKTGEKVIYYGPEGRKIAYIDCNGIPTTKGIVLIVFKKDGRAAIYAHEKQLRKLKKKEPSIVYVAFVNNTIIDCGYDEEITKRINSDCIVKKFKEVK